MPDKKRELRISGEIKSLNNAQALLAELSRQFEPRYYVFNLLESGDYHDETYYITASEMTQKPQGDSALDYGGLEIFCLAWLKGRNSWK